MSDLIKGILIGLACPLLLPLMIDRKDEPQTCSVNGRPYDCGNCEYHKCTADEPQTERSE